MRGARKPHVTRVSCPFNRATRRHTCVGSPERKPCKQHALAPDRREKCSRIQRTHNLFGSLLLSARTRCSTNGFSPVGVISTSIQGPGTEAQC